MKRPTRTAFIGLVALVFGLITGIVHGKDGGLQLEVGNLVAPWLLIAAIPAWWSGSVVRGVLVGLATTMVALVGFYVGLTIMLYGHVGQVHGAWESFRYLNHANRSWYQIGLVSGPLCGGLAAALRKWLHAQWVWALAGLAPLAESVWVASGLVSRSERFPIFWSPPSPTSALEWLPYIVEAALALALISTSFRMLRARTFRSMGGSSGRRLTDPRHSKCFAKPMI